MILLGHQWHLFGDLLEVLFGGAKALSVRFLKEACQTLTCGLVNHRLTLIPSKGSVEDDEFILTDIGWEAAQTLAQSSLYHRADGELTSHLNSHPRECWNSSGNVTSIGLDGRSSDAQPRLQAEVECCSWIIMYSIKKKKKGVGWSGLI